MATPAVSAIGAYRNLLRATRIAFQGDYRILYAARAEARKQFDANRREGIDTPMKIQHALETAQILKTNLVQGQRVESVDENGQTKEKYELRIHEHIERGDNESIKTAGKSEKADGICCSSR